MVISWGRSQLWRIHDSSFRAAFGTPGFIITVAFCDDSSGGLLGSPGLGFHVCHLCWSDPAPSAPASWRGTVGAGERLPSRKTKRWCSTSKNRWAASPLGETSRRARRALACGPERESGSFGRRPVSAGVAMDECRTRANFGSSEKDYFRHTIGNSDSQICGMLGNQVPKAPVRVPSIGCFRLLP